MSDPRRELEHLLRVRREAERILRDVAQPEAADGEGGPRISADVLDAGDRFLVELELPGVRRDDVRLTIVGDALVVEGHKREERPPGRAAWGCAERAYGPFRRLVRLPGATDAGRADARLEHGVLTIVLPKVQERRGRPRPIEIR